MLQLEQQKQYELYCELEELYNTNEPIFYLLEQYYDLDFSNMNPDDKELGKMYDLVFEHPYDDYWNLKRLIQNSSNYKGNVSLLTYEVIYGDKEKAYECLIEDTKERIKELKSNSDLILLDLKVLHKLDYNNITIANVEKIDEFLDMPF